MCRLIRYYEAPLWLGGGGRWQPVKLLRLSREPAGVHPPGEGPVYCRTHAWRFVPSAGEGRTWEHGRSPRALALPVHPGRDAQNVDLQRWHPHGQEVLVAGWHRQSRNPGPGRPGDRERPGRSSAGRILAPVPAVERVRPCAPLRPGPSTPAVLRAFNTHHKCTGVCRSVRGIPVGIRRCVAELWGFCGLAEALDWPGRGSTGTQVPRLPDADDHFRNPASPEQPARPR